MVKPKPKEKTPAQLEVVGTERPRIEEIDEASSAYRRARDVSAGAKEALTEAGSILIGAMHDNDQTLYVDCDGHSVKVTKKDGLQVKKHKEPKE